MAAVLIGALLPGTANAQQLVDRMRDAAKQAASDALYRTAARLFGLKDPVAERKMSAADLQSAAAAQQLFDRSYSFAAGATFDPTNKAQSDAQIASFREAFRKFAKNKKLTDADLLMIAPSLLPFVRYVAALKGDQANAVLVPPGTARRVTIQTYCMDHDAPAPRADELIHLVPSSRLIPEHGKQIYAALMEYSARHPSDHGALQNLVWGMRHARAAAPFISILAPDQMAMLNRTNTKGAVLFQTYLVKEMVHGRLDTIKVQLYQNAVQRLEKATGTHLPPPSNNGYSLKDVESVLALLQLAPVKDGAFTAGSDYTLLTPGVAIRSVSGTVGIHQTDFEILNTSCDPYTFQGGDFVGQSTRVTQRLALGGVVTTGDSDPLQPLANSIGSTDLKALLSKLNATAAAVPAGAATTSAIIGDGVWSAAEVEILRALSTTFEWLASAAAPAAGEILMPALIICWPSPAGEGSDLVHASDNPIAWPGWDPARGPKGFDTWKGETDQPANSKGAWVNTETGESWSPDLEHGPPKGSHWTYNDGKGNAWDVFPDGRAVQTKGRDKDGKKVDDKKGNTEKKKGSPT
jgi:hypothetical protein